MDASDAAVPTLKVRTARGVGLVVLLGDSTNAAATISVHSNHTNGAACEGSTSVTTELNEAFDKLGLRRVLVDWDSCGASSDLGGSAL